jgi:hypothetical protein
VSHPLWGNGPQRLGGWLDAATLKVFPHSVFV